MSLNLQKGTLKIPEDFLEFFKKQGRKEVAVPYSEETKSWPPFVTEKLISKNGEEVFFSRIEYSNVAKMRIEQNVITEFIFLHD